MKAAPSTAREKDSHHRTALVIVGSSLAVLAAAAATGGNVDATHHMQNHQNSRRLQVYDGVLIHLESQCNACIGTNTLVGAAQPGSNLEIVDCADVSTNVQKFWRISQGGNWCLKDSEVCVFYNSTIAAAAWMILCSPCKVERSTRCSLRIRIKSGSGRVPGSSRGWPGPISAWY